MAKHKPTAGDYSGTQQEFEEILNHELELLASANKQITIMYSGGVDSSCLLSAMLMRGMKDIVVLYSDGAEPENPELFKVISGSKNVELKLANGQDMLCSCKDAMANGLLLTGTSGDMLFKACFGAVPEGVDLAAAWHTAVDDGVVFEQLQEAFKYYDAPIKTVEDLCFWLTYAFLWYRGQPALLLSTYPNKANHVDLFSAESFQQWAYARFPGRRGVFGEAPDTYKPEMKAIITKFLGSNSSVAAKVKVHSFKPIVKDGMVYYYVKDEASTYSIPQFSVSGRSKFALAQRIMELYRVSEE